MKLRAACVVLGFLSLAQMTFAQSTAETASALPRLVRFGGTVKDLNGNPLTGVVGITFALYSEQTGGAALWLETQNVTADGTGRYVALLGSSKPDGLPTELFISEQARWVGVQVSGQAEQPRVLLLSVPYALKAADAETLGGKPASAYLLNPQPREGVSAPARSEPAAASKASNTEKSVVPATITGGGTKNYIPLWTSSSNLGNSIVYQSTTGLGIGTTSPLATLDIRKSTGMRAIASGNGIAVYGNATVTSGTGKGVEGDTNSTSGTGVAGNALATTGNTSGTLGWSYSTSGTGVSGVAKATSGRTFGVSGTALSQGGFGVNGIYVGPSQLGSSITLYGSGVWGDTDQLAAVAVLGSADDGQGVAGWNNSAANYAVAAVNVSTSPTASVFATYGEAFGGLCTIDVKGNLTCSGTKSAVVPVSDGRQVALYAVESPENWFEDAGSGQLAKGSAVINLEPIFAQTVNAGIDYHVFLTPRGECEGLFITNATATAFEVHELHHGSSNVAFDYRIMAHRKGYENIRLADMTERFKKYPLPNRLEPRLRGVSTGKAIPQNQ